MTHPTWELPVADNQASLVLTPCPGTKGTPLPESIAQLKAQGVSAVVTALSMRKWSSMVSVSYQRKSKKPDYSGFMRRSKMIARRMRPLRKIGSIAHPLCIRHSAAVKKSLCIAWEVRVVLAYWPRICCWKKVGRWKASLLRCKH